MIMLECVGRCETCHTVVQVGADQIMAANPGLAEIPQHFTADCAECGTRFTLHRREVQVTEVPFAEAMVLPADSGCPECGRDHEPDQPHDQQSLVYQYRFRNAEARAGREERWPTWADAMAHCPPEVQDQWRSALTERGVSVEG